MTVVFITEDEYARFQEQEKEIERLTAIERAAREWYERDYMECYNEQYNLDALVVVLGGVVGKAAKELE